MNIFFTFIVDVQIKQSTEKCAFFKKIQNKKFYHYNLALNFVQVLANLESLKFKNFPARRPLP